MNKLAFKLIMAHISHEKQVALMKFLAREATRMGIAEHAYVVGGAVRNHVLKQPIKDIDITVDSVALGGRGSDWFAQQLQVSIPTETNLTTNQYGVAILTVKGPWNLDGHEMQGEVIEIANARKESYGGSAGKGYKPDTVEPATIQDDIYRREFTFNTLLWRLSELADGPDKAQILDLTGRGLSDLNAGILTTPSDPDKTFRDDPTRLLRVIKFTSKYGFKIPPAIKESITRNAPAMKNAPWEAIGTLLVDEVLSQPTAREALVLMKELGLLDVVREMVMASKPFEAYLNRSLSEKNVKLLIHMLDLGFTVKSPLSGFSEAQNARIRAVTSKMTEDDAQQFFENLKKPEINFEQIINVLKLKGREIAVIKSKAQELLLEKPDLFRSPELWTNEVLRALKVDNRQV